MVTTTMTVKGQVVIPSAIRVRLGLKKGVRFVVRESGREVVLEPIDKKYVASLSGILKGDRSLTKDLLAGRAEDLAKEERKASRIRG